MQLRVLGRNWQRFRFVEVVGEPNVQSSLYVATPVAGHAARSKQRPRTLDRSHTDVIFGQQLEGIGMSLTQLSRSIDGLVAVITGAGSGMGAATAKLFADQGAKVAALDLNEASVAGVVQITAAGKSAKAWQSISPMAMR